MSDDEFEEKPKKQRVAKKKHDVTILLIDSGSNMSGNDFRDAIRTTEWLLTRKIMRQKNEMTEAEKKSAGTTPMTAEEEFGIIVFGSDQTNNDLDIDGVAVHKDCLEKALFDHMRYLTELQPTETPGDFVDGLIVAVDWLRNQIDGDESVVNKRIVMLTNAQGVRDADTDALEGIANGMRALEMELFVVGVSEADESEGVKTVQSIIDSVNGHLYSFDNAGEMISQLSSHQKLNRLMGFCLQLSKDVKLPLKCIPYISKTRSDKEERMRAVDPNTLLGVRRIQKYVVKDIGDDAEGSNSNQAQSSNYNTGGGTGGAAPWKSNAGALILGDQRGEEGVVKKEEIDESTAPRSAPQKYIQVQKGDLVLGYDFGMTKLTLTEEERAAYRLSFNKKEKGGTMELICTAPKENIHVAYLIGDETRVFIPDERKGDGRGNRAVHAFVQGLINTNTVGIARFAWNKASEPHMIALVPRIHEKYGTPMLYALRLPFADDVRHTSFADLEEVDPVKSMKKLDVIDDLIDVFQGANEKSGKSASRRLLNSYLKKNQLIFKKVGLNTSVIKEEEDKLPEGAEEVLKKLKEEFPIVDYKEMKREMRKEKKFIPEVDVDALAEGMEDMEDEEDIKPLKEELDEKIAKSGSEMKGMTVFLKEQFAMIIINAGTDDDAIDLSKLKYARAWCIKNSLPKLFNDTMRKLRNLDEVVEWALSVRDACLRPIDSDECRESLVSLKEASNWWKPQEVEGDSQWEQPDSQAPDLED